MAGLIIPDLVLICGYTRHGKDTLFERKLCVKDYDVYGKEASRPFPDFSCYGDGFLNRIAFADKVKYEVADLLGMSVGELELRKDEPLAAPFGTSYRSYLISVANSKRDKDPYHWCRQAFQQNYREGGSVNVVTDLRFPEELEYARTLSPPCLSIRVHRPEVAIPPVEIYSEHALDELEPDFVVTSKGARLEKLVADLPYIARYQYLTE